MGLTTSEDSYTTGIFNMCLNIPYLLRVIYSISHTFQFFTHLTKNCAQILDFNKITLSKKKVDKMPKDNISFTLFYLDSSFSHSASKL
jgi:hypothetical protein